MPGIIPEIRNGAVVTRTVDGVCANPLNVQNAFCPPVAFTSTCELKALPEDCVSRISPSQINAIVSELMCFAATLDPNGQWDCDSVCNIATAFENAGDISVTVTTDGITIGGDGSPDDPVTLIPAGVVASICDTPGVAASLVECLLSGDVRNAIVQGSDGKFLVHLATTAEAIAGTDDDSVMTPATAAAATQARLTSYGLGTVNPPVLANLDEFTTPTGRYGVTSATTGTKPADMGTSAGDVDIGRYSGAWVWQIITIRADAADATMRGARLFRQGNASTMTWSVWSIIFDESVLFRFAGNVSKKRSLIARFNDTVHLREFFDRTGADATAAENDAAWGGLAAYINANPNVKTVIGNQGDVHRFTMNNKQLPNGTRLMADGARFRCSGDNGAGNNYFLSIGNNGVVEGLGIDVVTGSTFRRLFQTETAARIRDMEIIAENQINNYGGSLLDWACRVYRSYNDIKGLKIQNIDRAFFAYGADGDGNPGIENRLEDILVKNYVTGICVRNQNNGRLLNPFVLGRSPNATTDPGNNGILFEGIREYYIANAKVHDAGEHGMRFGGTRNAEQQSVGIVLHGAQIWRSGQSGLKFFTGTVGQGFNQVNVSNVEVVDCASRTVSPNPGFNDEGFLLQQISRGVFSGLSVFRQASPGGFSCMDGCYISGADQLRINGLTVANPLRNAVRIAETDDGGGGAPVETRANTGVHVIDLYGNAIGEHGVFFDHPTQSIRDISIHARDLIGNNAAGFSAIGANMAIARVAQPSLIEVKQRQFASGLTSLASSGHWKVRDIFSNAY